MKLTKKELAMLAYWLNSPETCNSIELPEEQELMDKIYKKVDKKLYEKYGRKVDPDSWWGETY